MKDKSSNKKKKIIYILFPIFVVATIIELILLLNTGTSNKELNGNGNNEIKSINKSNYDDEMTLGDILFNSTDVGYNNSNSGLTSTNVKAAIDELYQIASSCSKPKNNTVYYAVGTPTTSSTTDYTTLNKNIFVALNGSQKSVCIIRNSRLHCFDSNNWPIEKDHIQQVFNDVSCHDYTSRIDCYASYFNCSINSNGNVGCYYDSTNERCTVYSGGSVSCN